MKICHFTPTPPTLRPAKSGNYMQKFDFNVNLRSWFLEKKLRFSIRAVNDLKREAGKKQRVQN